ncbi:hypothetical protein EDD18DRAFT_1347259 [Armillaria luteobubalina]|uniref:Uncharacterized protein n=1 Tax=Armillaria luteobubalina TaxID=153913 RepID=A0AA39QHT0_9AGAR|nr:hypothetical protein EDD18DRAFT_1347259 [Armillaria luteobubalina]
MAIHQHDMVFTHEMGQFLGFNTHTENAWIDTTASEGENPLLQAFSQTGIPIDVPSGDFTLPSRPFVVPAHQFHFSPFKLFHNSSDTGESTHVYSELYNSDAFIKVDDNIKLHGKIHPSKAGCTLEKVVAALMGFSDATHLTQFGNAKAWPIYLVLGNLSKYFQAHLSSGAMHHLAYVPSLPDSFQDFTSSFHSKWKAQKHVILAHCQKELMHAIWNFLLDDDFMHAYHYGMVIDCINGVKQHVYLRFFTYSTDYPEKVLLATIQDNSLCPCLWCFIGKEKLDLLGQKCNDKICVQNFCKYLPDGVIIAHRAIYSLSCTIGGSVVNQILKPTSHVPTLNAFVNQIGKDFNPFKMLIVDFLHEFELGVWKSLFIHLICLLYAEDHSGELVSKLNQRYHQIAMVGQGTIRKFAENSAKMKKLAAQDFEDLLQCAIPAFYGLLPEPFNGLLQTLLDKTSTYDTVELPCEAAACDRAAQQRAQALHGQTETNVGATLAHPQSSSTHWPCKLNLNMYKFHSLGDYVASIHLFGTTDLYSTQMGELAHHLIKNFYGLTNKKDAMSQVSWKYAHMCALQNMYAGVSSNEWIAVAIASFNSHHFLSDSQNKPFNIYTFGLNTPGSNSMDLESNMDPVKKNFIPKLQDHLLGYLE